MMPNTAKRSDKIRKEMCPLTLVTWNSCVKICFGEVLDPKARLVWVVEGVSGRETNVDSVNSSSFGKFEKGRG